AALEATLPGYTPALPPQPTSSPAASPTPAEENQNDSGYTVQGEIAWLGEERDKDAALLLKIKRCLVRKEIDVLDQKIAKTPAVGTGERETLLKEKEAKLEYLKQTKPWLKCTKSPEQTVQPTQVSRRAVDLMTKGEGAILTAYVALEGQTK